MLENKCRYIYRETVVNRSIRGHKKYIISMLLVVMFLTGGTSVAALLPQYERLQPVTTKIKAPTAVALDKYECIFVAESTKNAVHIFNQSGEYTESLTGLDMPISVAVDGNDRIFVGNKKTGNVEVYDEDLDLLFKLGTGNGEFVQPGAIEIDNSGNIYVVDSGDDLVKVYNSDGSVNFTFGGTGSEDGNFNFPTAIAINEAVGELVVVDHQFITNAFGGQTDGARVQVFDMDGIFKREFGEYGVGEGLMANPMGVAVDGEGRIYVSDTLQNVIHIFDGADGNYLGTIYDIDNPMRTPLDITLGGSNRLLVASLSSRQVEVYGIADYTNMQTSPLTLSFEGGSNGSAPALQNVVITNNGSDVLSWTAVTYNEWITLSAASGSTALSGTSNLSIGVDLSGLATGVYTGYVTIGSGSSAADVVTVNLTVTGLPQLAANAGGPYSAVEGTDVVFNGSGSDGTVTLYEWDVDCDGIYEYSTVSSTQLHTYAQSGTYTVNLRVTDAGGNTSEATTTATISDASPTAAFSTDTTTGSGPLTVNFINSSTGYDQSLIFAWDFDCDGTTDSTLKNPSHTFTTAGTYTVLLRVTDSDGSIDTLMKTNYITVTSGSGIEECSNFPIKKNSFYYSTLQNAHDSAAEGESIKLHKLNISNSLSVSRDVTVILQGGYNCDYSGTEGMTSINGNITVNTGTLIIGNVILE